ncbi:hypothetical protein AAY473_021542 [Plecturocebus cupreus]
MLRIRNLAQHGGSHLESQHFVRLRQADHLRSGVRDQPGQHGNMNINRGSQREHTSQKECQSTKESRPLKKWKPCQAQWFMLIVPLLWEAEASTQGAEAGESLELRRQMLQRSQHKATLWLQQLWSDSRMLPQHIRAVGILPASCLTTSTTKPQGDHLRLSDDSPPPGNSSTCTVSCQQAGRLRQESHLNPGGGGCSESRSCRCTPARTTKRDSVSKKKKK